MEDTSKQQRSFQQFSTFIVAGRHYGIEVTKVQEVIKPMKITSVPLAPTFVKGLINLRGQVATAVDLTELFEIQSRPDKTDDTNELMNVVCRLGGFLMAFQVEEIGDVLELETKNFEETPPTVPVGIKRFMSGVFKTDQYLLSIIDIDKINGYLQEKAA